MRQIVYGGRAPIGKRRILGQNPAPVRIDEEKTTINWCRCLCICIPHNHVPVARRIHLKLMQESNKKELYRLPEFLNFKILAYGPF